MQRTAGSTLGLPAPHTSTGGGVRRRLHDNGLVMSMFVLFALAYIGQSFTGYRSYNDDQRQHEEAPIGFGSYLKSGDFLELTFENWESEWLQMGSFVLLTALFVQRGASESKDPDNEHGEAVNEDPREARNDPNAPWPVRRGGLILRLYEHSLTIALFLLFAITFVLHDITGARAYSADELQHGGHAVSAIQFLGSPHFWMQSFQNWQSEFLSVGVLLVLSIFLRQRGSPESKPTARAHRDTGNQ